jgi:hypothetical protein
MSFFGDILDDADNRLDYDRKEPFKCDDPKTASFKVKSAPAKGIVSELSNFIILLVRTWPKASIS